MGGSQDGSHRINASIFRAHTITLVGFLDQQIDRAFVAYASTGKALAALAHA
jgi:hypothetical protein